MLLDFYGKDGRFFGFNERINLPRGVFRVPEIGKFHQGVQDIFVQDVASGQWFDQNGKPCPRAVTRRYKMPPNDALPSTIQAWIAIKIGEFFYLTRPWQEFWRDLIDCATQFTLSKETVPIDQLTPSHLLYWWRYATQHSLALTDNHSREQGFADYLLGVNLDNPKPIAIKSLTMSGNLFKEIGYTSNHIIVETLNAGTINSKGVFISAPPPKVADVWDKHWLIHWGVESTTALLPDGTYVQSAFPPKPWGLPFPFMGIDGKNLIKFNRLKRIPNNTLYSPYWPMPR